MKKAADFWSFVMAGRALGDLHVGYESVEPYPVTIKQGDLSLAHIDDPVKFFRVEKMTFGKGKDRSVIHYNPNITLIDVPLAAYDYVVNGKPAIDWVMERQAVKVDKDSGIVNDANDYANETVGDPPLPLRSAAPRHHRQPGDDEDRQVTTAVGDLKLSEPSGYDEEFWARLRAEILGREYQESVDEFQRRNAGPSRPTGQKGRRAWNIAATKNHTSRDAKLASKPTTNGLSEVDIAKWLKEPPDWSST